MAGSVHGRGGHCRLPEAAPRDIGGHRAYEAALAGQNIVQTFGLATGFLRLALAVARDPSRLG